MEQLNTNSVPFLVLCDDGEFYVAKTMFKPQAPFEDLINEILCVYFLEIFGVKTIPACLISIPEEVFEEFKRENNSYDSRYDNLDFGNKLFFGSFFRETTTEMEAFNLSLNNKRDFKKYENPTDFIKIGVYDFWIGNMDRRENNLNILVNQTDNNKFEFLPIDHTQTFANQSKYKALNLALMNSPHSKTILKTPISKSILKFADPKIVTNLHSDIFEGFENIIRGMEFVFDQIPTSFGLSKKGKARIKKILSDEERNLKVSKIYHNYIK